MEERAALSAEDIKSQVVFKRSLEAKDHMMKRV